MRRLLLCAVCVCVPAALRATVLIPIEFRELVTVSTAIVHGRVADVRAEWTDDRRNVETLVTIEAREYLKGDLGASVTVRVPGGQIGRYRTVFIGAPEFRIDDEVVLFLKGGAIVGLNQGAFRVEPDARTGRPVVVSPIVMSAAAGAQRVVRGETSRRPVAIEVFRNTVRQVLAGTAR
jgi:hypothetical protein